MEPHGLAGESQTHVPVPVPVHVYILRSHVPQGTVHRKDLLLDNHTNCSSPNSFGFAETKSQNYHILVYLTDDTAGFCIELVRFDTNQVIPDGLKLRGGTPQTTLYSRACSKNAALHEIEKFGFAMTSCRAYGCGVDQLGSINHRGLVCLRVTLFNERNNTKRSATVMPQYIFSNTPDIEATVDRLRRIRQQAYEALSAQFVCCVDVDPRFHPGRRTYTNYDRRTLCICHLPAASGNTPMTPDEIQLMRPAPAPAPASAAFPMIQLPYPEQTRSLPYNLAHRHEPEAETQATPHARRTLFEPHSLQPLMVHSPNGPVENQHPLQQVDAPVVAQRMADPLLPLDEFPYLPFLDLLGQVDLGEPEYIVNGHEPNGMDDAFGYGDANGRDGPLAE